MGLRVLEPPHCLSRYRAPPCYRLRSRHRYVYEEGLFGVGGRIGVMLFDCERRFVRTLDSAFSCLHQDPHEPGEPGALIFCLDVHMTFYYLKYNFYFVVGPGRHFRYSYFEYNF